MRVPKAFAEGPKGGLTNMSESSISLLLGLAPFLVFVGLCVLGYRQGNTRYKAQTARIEESIKLQQRAIKQQDESIALLREIRDALKAETLRKAA
jgi:hypothetical protein